MEAIKFQKSNLKFFYEAVTATAPPNFHIPCASQTSLHRQVHPLGEHTLALTELVIFLWLILFAVWKLCFVLFLTNSLVFPTCAIGFPFCWMNKNHHNGKALSLPSPAAQHGLLFVTETEFLETELRQEQHLQQMKQFMSTGVILYQMCSWGISINKDSVF